MRRVPFSRFPVPAAPAIALALALAGCSGGSELVRDTAMRSGLVGGEPKPAPDFVTSTRPDRADYMPVGVSAPPRAVRKKTREEAVSAEAEMEALRKRNEARAGVARRASGAN